MLPLQRLRQSELFFKAGDIEYEDHTKKNWRRSSKKLSRGFFEKLENIRTVYSSSKEIRGESYLKRYISEENVKPKITRGGGRYLMKM
jgi:hypothetical protein